MSELMAERYGARTPGRRPWVAVAVVLAVVGLSWLAWAAFFHSNPAVEAQVASYDVRGTHEVQADLAIRLGEPDATGTCLVRATAADHTIVGEKNVRVHELVAEDERTVSIRTERRATSVTVIRCTED